MKTGNLLSGPHAFEPGKSPRLPKRLFFIVTLIFLMQGCDFLDDFFDEPPASVLKPHLDLIAEGLTSPLMATEAPDKSGRLFVVDQIGLIRIISAEGELENDPFLDIRDKLVELNAGYDERGLLSLAFHPQFADNTRFFVFYSGPLRAEAPDDWDHTNYVSEFTASPNGKTADPASEKVILMQDHPFGNHNGGTVAFGPKDGYLYISIGDGGNRDDEGIGHVEDWYQPNAGGNGQDITQNFMGDILRLDVDGGMPYAIPPNNPFVDREGLDEIYAYGFRNPYQFSFDMKGNHDLYAQDAGQELLEEINRVEMGGNYGWNVKEGTICFDAANPETPMADCPERDPEGDPLVDPVIEFDNAKDGSGVAVVVVGGYVYHGHELPHFKGRYFFGGWSDSFRTPNGVVLSVRPRSSQQLWDFNEVSFANTPGGDLNAYLMGFGQDMEGELYVLTKDNTGPEGNTGKVYKMTGGDWPSASNKKNGE